MYLEKRRRLYYAVHDIPPALRECFGGKRKFIASLGTSDPETARLEGAKKESEWRHIIKEMRARLKAAGGDYANADGLAAYRVQLSIERDPLSAYVPPPPEIEPTRFDQWVDDWAPHSGLSPKSLHMAKTTIRKFADEIPLEALTRGRVRDWIDAQSLSGKAVATIRRALSELRNYWEYLEDKQTVSRDLAPFEQRLKKPKPVDVDEDDETEEEEEARRPFPTVAIAQFVNMAEESGDNTLADVIRIAAFTGARIEEVCRIQVEHVKWTHIFINGTKTKSAKRNMPIHPDLMPTIRRLVDAAVASGDKFLISGLTPNKYKKRSPAVSKRFGRLRTKAGYSDEYVFHSIRKTFSNIVRNVGGADTDLVAQMLGHKTGKVTTDVYAMDPSIELKKEKVDVIRYPGYIPR